MRQKLKNYFNITDTTKLESVLKGKQQQNSLNVGFYEDEADPEVITVEFTPHSQLSIEECIGLVQAIALYYRETYPERAKEFDDLETLERKED